MSEKYYWVILILALVIFDLLVGFVLIPKKIVEYNLGINLITESFGILFTIVFLTWLLRVRESLQWKPVKNRIIERIKNQLEHYVLLLENLCKIPSDCSTLADIITKEEIELKDGIEKYFSKERGNLEGYIDALEESADDLYEIETKYSRFLDPDLVESLMLIEEEARNIAFSLRILRRVTFSNINDERQWFQKALPPAIRSLMKELYKIRKMGIEIPIDLQGSKTFLFDLRSTKGFP